MQVAVVAEGKSDHSAWLWHDITMVITTEEVSNEEAKKLMCTAHQNHANFAFISKCTCYTTSLIPIAQCHMSDNVTNDASRIFYII